jgi:hypothetical protein
MGDLLSGSIVSVALVMELPSACQKKQLSRSALTYTLMLLGAPGELAGAFHRAHYRFWLVGRSLVGAHCLQYPGASYHQEASPFGLVELLECER